MLAAAPSTLAESSSLLVTERRFMACPSVVGGGARRAWGELCRAQWAMPVSTRARHRRLPKLKDECRILGRACAHVRPPPVDFLDNARVRASWFSKEGRWYGQRICPPRRCRAPDRPRGGRRAGAAHRGVRACRRLEHGRRPRAR